MEWKTVAAITVTCGVYLKGINETYLPALRSFCIETHSIFALHAVTDRHLLVIDEDTKTCSWHSADVTVLCAPSQVYLALTVYPVWKVSQVEQLR